MSLVIFLAMLTACAAVPQDLSGKMFTFPQETNTARVTLTSSVPELSALTVCLRFFTDLGRPFSLFSLFATSDRSKQSNFLIYKSRAVSSIWAKGKVAEFAGLEFSLNEWHSICAAWDSASGIGQLWFDGKPSSRKFLSSGSKIQGPITIVIGQEQKNLGINTLESFVGMMSDVHVWDKVTSRRNIWDYTRNSSFSPGNVLNWGSLDFQIIDRVLIEYV